MATPTLTNTNLDNATREIWEDTVQKEVIEKDVILSAIMLGNGIDQTRSGGKYISKSLDYAEFDSLATWYAETDPLTATDKTYLDRAYVLWKNMHVSTHISLDEEMDNVQADSSAKVTDLASDIVSKVQKAMRIKLRNAFYAAYDAATPPATGGGSDGKQIFSIIRALYHGTAATDMGYNYLGLTRDLDAATRDWFQGADIATDLIKYSGSPSSAQTTAYTASYDTFSKAWTACKRNTADQDASNYKVILGSPLWRAFKAWVKADEVQVNPSKSMRQYGFQTFSMDGVEFVLDDTLSAEGATDYGTITNSTYTPDKWFIMLYLPSWKFYIHKKRSFWMMPTKWQGDVENGYDRWLIRGFLRCAAACWQPNANLLHFNMS